MANLFSQPSRSTSGYHSCLMCLVLGFGPVLSLSYGVHSYQAHGLFATKFILFILETMASDFSSKKNQAKNLVNFP